MWLEVRKFIKPRTIGKRLFSGSAGLVFDADDFNVVTFLFRKFGNMRNPGVRKPPGLDR